MWSRITRTAFQAEIQHRRIQRAATPLLGVRLLEGIACWVILDRYYGDVTPSAGAVDAVFAVYALGNCVLFRLHRRRAMNAHRVWLDIALNLLPMALAAHWSGGIYSPLIPVFVVKTTTYTQFFGVDVGWQCLTASVVLAIALAFGEQFPIGRMKPVEDVSVDSRWNLDLLFDILAYGIIIGAGLKFFRLLQDREHRLAVTASEKEILYQTSLRQQADLRRLSRGMMRVGEQTMRRLARELHDGVGQALTAVKMDLGLIEREVSGNESVRARVSEAREQIGTVLHEVRNLSQLLHPAVLDDLGLIPAMQSYTNHFSERNGIAVELEARDPDKRLPRPVEAALYRVLQEGLTNIARHARAQHVNVRFDVNREVVRLQIADDGRGFDTTRLFRSTTPRRGMGVISMRERVATYGGHFAIESDEGMGTRVMLSIPLTQPIDDFEDDNGENSAENSRLTH